jgi:release factor glutamine methyltransferase
MFVQHNTVSSCLAYVKDRLENQFSITEIRQIQRQIFEKIFAWSPTDLMLNQNYRLSESELLLVRDFVKRLQNHEPLQYIMGYTQFCDLKILCDARALIPRPETEELVYKILEQNRSVYSDFSVLDLCTGSGCIALALKSACKEAHVFGVDLSQEALDLAESNAKALHLDVNWRKEDVLRISNESPLNEQQWDIIVSNPPYIPEREKTKMESNVLDFEPHLALFVQNHEPIIFYESIIAFAVKALKSDGLLAFELHENLVQDVKLACSQNGFSYVEIFEDLQGKPRMLIARF